MKWKIPTVHSKEHLRLKAHWIYILYSKRDHWEHLKLPFYKQNFWDVLRKSCSMHCLKAWIHALTNVEKECIKRKLAQENLANRFHIPQAAIWLWKSSLFWSDNKLLEEIMILPGIFQPVPKTCGKLKVSSQIPNCMYSSILVVKSEYGIFLLYYQKYYTPELAVGINTGLIQSFNYGKSLAPATANLFCFNTADL